MTAAETMSRRDVWLTIALAIAKGEMPEPDEVEIRQDLYTVDILYRESTSGPGMLAAARKAAEHFGVPWEAQHSPTDHVWYRHARDPQWAWTIRAYLAEPAPEVGDPALAEQVIAAIGATS